MNILCEKTLKTQLKISREYICYTGCREVLKKIKETVYEDIEVLTEIFYTATFFPDTRENIFRSEFQLAHRIIYIEDFTEEQEADFKVEVASFMNYKYLRKLSRAESGCSSRFIFSVLEIITEPFLRSESKYFTHRSNYTLILKKNLLQYMGNICVECNLNRSITSYIIEQTVLYLNLRYE